MSYFPSSDEEPTSLQFTLGAMFVLTSLFAILLGLFIRVGPALSIGAFVLLVPLSCVGLLWGLCLRLAPEATKVFTVVGLIAFMTLPLVPIWLVRTREEARRTECSNRMKQISLRVLRAHTAGLWIPGDSIQPIATRDEESDLNVEP